MSAETRPLAPLPIEVVADLARGREQSAGVTPGGPERRRLQLLEHGLRFAVADPDPDDSGSRRNDQDVAERGIDHVEPELGRRAPRRRRLRDHTGGHG